MATDHSRELGSIARLHGTRKTGRLVEWANSGSRKVESPAGLKACLAFAGVRSVDPDDDGVAVCSGWSGKGLDWP